MRTRRPSPPSPEDIKRQLEAAVGHTLDISHDQLLKLRFPVGTYAYLGPDENANSTWASIFFPGKYCNPATLVDVCGGSFTGADGKRVFLLSTVVCSLQGSDLSEPVTIVVTPLSETPFLTTMTYALVPNPQNPQFFNDLQITVFAWDTNGAPAANVGFHWRCRLVANPIIL
jgi:hypothetical protein